jgi:hypothetical protein
MLTLGPKDTLVQLAEAQALRHAYSGMLSQLEDITRRIQLYESVLQSIDAAGDTFSERNLYYVTTASLNSAQFMTNNACCAKRLI